MSRTNTKIKTGSYSVTTVYSMPWVKKKKTTTKKKRAEKKVVYKIFEQCSKLIEDPYWISVFKECARENFPRGFSYKNGLLIHRRGNKLNRVLITNKSSSDVISTCLSFFKTLAGLMSVADRKRVQNEEEEKLLNMNINMEWSGINLINVKELLINEFISGISKSGGFDKVSKKELTTTIKRGFMLKHFKSKDVEMSNGKIKSIQGLIYDKDNNEYKIDPKLILKRPGRKVIGLGIERKEIKSKISFMEMWVKYLESLEKEKQHKDNFQVFETSNSTSNSGDLYYSITPSDSL